MDNVLLNKTEWMKTDFNETHIEPVLACVYCWFLFIMAYIIISNWKFSFSLLLVEFVFIEL